MPLFTSETAAEFGTPFTRENAAEMGRRGGIASGEVRRERRDIASMVKSMLESDIPLDDAQALMSQYSGLCDNDMMVSAVMLAQVFDRAMKGDLAAVKLIIEQENAANCRMADAREDDAFSKSLRELAAQMEAVADRQSL